MKFAFEYAGLYYDKSGTWGVRTVEIEGQWRHCGQETTRLHGRVRFGTVERGDWIAVPQQSGGVFLSMVADFMLSLTEWGDLAWYSGVGQVPYRFWLVLQGVPVAQDLLCPAVAVGQDKNAAQLPAADRLRE